MRLYELAIRSARANGFVHNEAIAYEVAARFYAMRGFEDFACVYRRNARYGYLRWAPTARYGDSRRCIRTLRQTSQRLARRALSVHRSSIST